jgi:hypothetical protein
MAVYITYAVIDDAESSSITAYSRVLVSQKVR